MRVGTALIAAALLLPVPGAGAATIRTSPVTLRVGVSTTLELTDVDPSIRTSGYADELGRPCVRDQSAWEIGVVDRARQPVSFDGDARYAPSSRVVRICGYTITMPEDGSGPVRTFAAEKLAAIPFSLPSGLAPLNLDDARGDALSPTWAPRSAGFRRLSLACARKRFRLAGPIQIGSDWTFKASGRAVPDNSSDYDTPVPPRYGGHATMSVDGEIRRLEHGELMIVAKVRLHAPGLRPTPGVPRCAQTKRRFSQRFELF
jgi:hypothetical protein